MPDTMTKHLTEPEEGPARFFNWRRTVRWITVLTAGIILVLAVWQEPI
jgi:hypothetical protein